MSTTQTQENIRLTDCERHKIRDNYARAQLMEYYDESWVDVSVQLKKAGIHLLQIFNSQVDPDTLNVTQSLTIAFHNPDPVSPINIFHFDSEKHFIKTPKTPLPVLDRTKHEIYVVPHEKDIGGKSLFHSLQQNAPSASCVCKGLGTTTVGIPFAQWNSAAIWGKCSAYQKEPTQAYLIGRYESEGGLPAAFAELCGNGVAGSNVPVVKALLDFATRFEAFSRMDTMITKGQRPFCGRAFG